MKRTTSIITMAIAVATGYTAGHWIRPQEDRGRPEDPVERRGKLAVHREVAPDATGFHDRLEQLPDDAFPDLIDTLHELPTLRARFALKIAMREWASRDAPAALVYYHSAKASAHWGSIGNGVFAAWAETDGETALSEASMHFAETKNDFRDIVLASWAKSDPPRAWRAALGLGDDPGTGVIHAIFSNWARLDASAALAELRGKEGGHWNRDLAEEIFLGTMLRIDGDLVVRECGDGDQPKFPVGAFEAWLAEDSVAAINLIRRTPLEHEARKKMLEVWLKNDPAATVEFLRGFGGGSLLDQVGYQLVSAHEHLSDRELINVLWSKEIPLGRLKEIAANSPELLSDPNGDLTYSMATAWAQADPVGGLAWVAGLPEDTREESYHNLMRHWAEVDLPAATAHLLETPPDRAHFEVLLEMDNGYPAKDVEDDAPYLEKIAPMVESWLGSLSQDQLAEVLPGNFWTVATHFPEEAKGWALELPPGTQRRDAVLSVMEALENRDEGAVLRWFPDLPAEFRQELFEPVFAEDDPFGDPDWSIQSRLGRYQEFVGMTLYEMALHLPESETRVERVLQALEGAGEFEDLDSLTDDQREQAAVFLDGSSLTAEEKALVQERLDGAP